MIDGLTQGAFELHHDESEDTWWSDHVHQTLSCKAFQFVDDHKIVFFVLLLINLYAVKVWYARKTLGRLKLKSGGVFRQTLHLLENSKEAVPVLELQQRSNATDQVWAQVKIQMAREI